MRNKGFCDKGAGIRDQEPPLCQPDADTTHIRHYELMNVRTNDQTKDSLNVNEQTDKKCCQADSADPPCLLKDRKHLNIHIGHTHFNQDSRRKNATKYLEKDMRENFLKWPS